MAEYFYKNFFLFHIATLCSYCKQLFVCECVCLAAAGRLTVDS